MRIPAALVNAKEQIPLIFVKDEDKPSPMLLSVNNQLVIAQPCVSANSPLSAPA